MIHPIVYVEKIWNNFQNDTKNCDDSCPHLSIKSERLPSEHFGQMRTDIIHSCACNCEDGGLTCPRVKETVEAMADMIDDAMKETTT